jgi:hypothetical protein
VRANTFLITYDRFALGVFAATQVTRVNVPVGSSPVTIDVPQDALFSALAAGGFALLFGVPARMAWACAVCGVASHTLRTSLFYFGMNLITGTLIGALLAGFWHRVSLVTSVRQPRNWGSLAWLQWFPALMRSVQYLALFRSPNRQ